MSSSNENNTGPCPRCLRHEPVGLSGICLACAADERRESDPPTDAPKAQVIDTGAALQRSARRAPEDAISGPPPKGQVDALEEHVKKTAGRPPAKATPAAAGARAIDRGKPAPGPAAGLPQLITGLEEEEAEKIVVYGPGGVGKSSWMASIPGVVLLQLESTPGLRVARYRPENLQEFTSLVRHLTTGDHQFTTVAIDSADELERMVVATSIKRANDRHDQPGAAENIEHVGGGYKKGYTAARARFAEVLADLEQMRTRRNLRVVISAHDVKVKVQNPMVTDSYDRYDLGLHAEIGRDLLYNWADDVLFVNFVTRVQKSSKFSRSKGVGGDERAMYTTNNDAYVAKNRHDLPRTMAFPEEGWHLYARAIEQWKSPQLLRHAIDAALERLGDLQVDVKGVKYPIAELVVQQLGANPSNQKLAQVRNRLELRVAEIEAAEEEAAANQESGS